jgi:hypothetical protein
MQKDAPKGQVTVLRTTTGDPYYDVGRYMPSDSVREADADWLRWRADARQAIDGINSTLKAAERGIPSVLAAHTSATTSSEGEGDRRVSSPGQGPVQVLIQVQREAIDVAKAHLAIAIDGQERASKQSDMDQVRVRVAQRQARIAIYFGAGGFAVGVLGLVYGFLI